MCGCVFASVSAEWSPIEICGDLWGEGQINEVFYSGGGAIGQRKECLCSIWSDSLRGCSIKGRKGQWKEEDTIGQLEAMSLCSLCLQIPKKKKEVQINQGIYLCGEGEDTL